MHKKKKIIVAVAALVTTMAVALSIYFVTRPVGTEGNETFTVEVTHQDGSTKSFTYNTHAEYVGAVLLGKELITGENGPYGLYVLEVDGEKLFMKKMEHIGHSM